MFGSHLSIAGGLHEALTKARELDMDCVQIFTKNQRQWRTKPLTQEQIDQWKQARTQTGIDMVVSHDSYLINLAGPDGTMRDNSINLFREELLRCEALQIPYLVTHPGAHMGQGEDEGLRRVAQALNQLHHELPTLRTITCLEVTAGQGSSLGYRFEHLRSIIDQTHEPKRLAVCIDTAHLIEAGYDLTSAQGCQATLTELDQVLGLDRVKVVHVNDSKTPRGSRVDRHEHIGKGHVSMQAFEVLMRDPHLMAVPKILETAKEDMPDGTPWDVVNLRVLRGLLPAGRSASDTSIFKSKRKNA